MQVPPSEVWVLLTKSRLKALQIELFDIGEKFWIVDRLEMITSGEMHVVWEVAKFWTLIHNVQQIVLSSFRCRTAQSFTSIFLAVKYDCFVYGCLVIS